MLGGYYLGQQYLGISGLPSSGALTVQDSSHTLTSDNIDLIQQHVIAIANASHSLTSDNLDLIEHKTLAIADAIHGLASDLITLTQAHTIVVQDALHGLSSDNITLVQQHLLAIANTTHDHTAEGDIPLNQYTLLNTPDSSVIGVTSPEILIVQQHLLIIDNSSLSLIDTLQRIINLADYQYFAGTYIKDFGSSGDLEEVGVLDAGTLILKQKQLGSFEPAEIDAGVFIKHTDKQGQLN